MAWSCELAGLKLTSRGSAQGLLPDSWLAVATAHGGRGAKARHASVQNGRCWRRVAQASSSRYPHDGKAGDPLLSSDSMQLLPARRRKARRQLAKALPLSQNTDALGTAADLAAALERQLSLDVDRSVLELKETRERLVTIGSKLQDVGNELELPKKDAVAILKDLGLTEEHIASVCLKIHNLALCHAKEDIRVKFDVLTQHGISDDDILNTVRRCPQFLHTPSDEIQAVILYLLDEGVSERKLGHIIMNSNCLPLDLETNLKPKLEFLKSLDIESVAFLVEKFPRLVGASLSTVRQNVEALKREVGPEALAEAVWKQPGILVVSTTTLLSSAKYLKQLLPEDELHTLLVMYPHILSLNWSKNVQKTIDYFSERCGLSAADVLKAKIVHRSLENTLLPRAEFLMSKGIRLLPAEGPGNKRGRGLKYAVESGQAYLSTVMNLPHNEFRDRFPDYLEYEAAKLSH